MDNAKLLTAFKQIQALAADAIAELAAPAPTPLPTPAPAPVKPGRAPENITGTVWGLDYTYYEGGYSKLPDFAKEKVVASGTVAQPTLTIRKREEGWAARFTGYFLAAVDGEYTFFTASDDGSRLLIGSEVIVNNDAVQGTTEKSGKITLQKGLHPISIQYFNYGGPQDLAVSYTAPGAAKAVIPASAYARVPAPGKPTPTPAPTPATAPVVPSLTVKVN